MTLVFHNIMTLVFHNILSERPCVVFSVLPKGWPCTKRCNFATYTIILHTKCHARLFTVCCRYSHALVLQIHRMCFALRRSIAPEICLALCMAMWRIDLYWRKEIFMLLVSTAEFCSDGVLVAVYEHKHPRMSVKQYFTIALYRASQSEISSPSPPPDPPRRR